MTDKGSNFFDECAAICVHLFPQGEDCTSSSLGDSKLYTSGSIANSQRMLKQTEMALYQNKDLSG